MELEQSKPLEEKQTITKTHIKNPKRVEQGKKLAAISKAAKQRKKEQMKTNTNEVEERSTTSLISSTGTILGTCCTLLLTFIAYSQWVAKPKIPPKIKQVPTHYKDLSKYDL